MARGWYAKTKASGDPMDASTQPLARSSDANDLSKDNNMPLTDSTNDPKSLPSPTSPQHEAPGVQKQLDSQPESEISLHDDIENSDAAINSRVGHQAPSDADGGLENPAPFECNGVLPEASGSQKSFKGVPKCFKVPLAPKKKHVKFVMPYRLESTASSFDSIRGAPGSEPQIKPRIRVASKKRKSARLLTHDIFPGSASRERVRKQKNCVLTPAAQVDIEQLKLGMVENGKRLRLVEQQLVNVTRDIGRIRNTLQLLEMENLILGTKLKALEEDMVRDNRQAHDNDKTTTSDPTPWTPWRVWRTFFCLAIVYFIVGCWGSWEADRKAEIERARRDMDFQQWQNRHGIRRN
ncbi:hypothetical protein TWF281_006591 [Arthrobotrys megalospora]